MTELELETLLPEFAYIFIESAEPGKRIGLIKRGEKGYYLTDFDSPRVPDDLVRKVIVEFNSRRNVTEAQLQAMEIGSMCGFDVPGADPRHHDLVQQRRG